jgi:hypothetical protein
MLIPNSLECKRFGAEKTAKHLSFMGMFFLTIGLEKFVIKKYLKQ